MTSEVVQLYSKMLEDSSDEHEFSYAPRIIIKNQVMIMIKTPDRQKDRYGKENQEID